MTGRPRSWLFAIAAAVILMIAGASVLRAADRGTLARAHQTLTLGRELREGHDALVTALRHVNTARFDQAQGDLVTARTLLGHAHQQLIALNRAADVRQVLALLDGVEDAQRLIAQLSK